MTSCCRKPWFSQLLCQCTQWVAVASTCPRLPLHSSGHHLAAAFLAFMQGHMLTECGGFALLHLLFSADSFDHQIALYPVAAMQQQQLDVGGPDEQQQRQQHAGSVPCLPPVALVRLPGKVSSIAWSPDIEGVLSVGDYDGTLTQVSPAAPAGAFAEASPAVKSQWCLVVLLQLHPSTLPAQCAVKNCLLCLLWQQSMSCCFWPSAYWRECGPCLGTHSVIITGYPPLWLLVVCACACPCRPAGPCGIWPLPQ